MALVRLAASRPKSNQVLLRLTRGLYTTEFEPKVAVLLQNRSFLEGLSGGLIKGLYHGLQCLDLRAYAGRLHVSGISRHVLSQSVCEQSRARLL